MNLLARWLGRATASPPRLTSPPLRPDALPPGTRLGALEIERPLARGASARLYRARDSASGATVAVKVLCANVDDATARARFLREGEHASQLEHPHIVRVFGGGEVGGIAFLSMELLAGSDLSRWARPQQRLPEALALEVAAQLGLALAHAHRRGVVHRDVKPANAIFDPARRRAVLTDFGLSRVPDAEATRSGLLLGSPAYMAPELLAGAAPDAASDCYALGVLAYELLAGQPPFAAASLGALLRAAATEPPPPLALLRPGLPTAAELDALLAPLLAKAREERLADGAQWAARARGLAAAWA